MRRIASPWSRAFKGISIDISNDATGIINRLLLEFKDSATPLLEESACAEVHQVKEVLQGHLEAIVTHVQDVINKERKEANRCLAPHILEVLKPGYDAAAPLSGPGSSARRKVCCIHPYHIAGH